MSRRPDAAHYDIDQLRGDLCASLISAVVILPVALAFGVASGLGAAAGLYGAIAAGFFAAVFGGTRCQISAPTAPTTVAMAVILTSHSSSLAEAMTVVIMGGLLQMLMGLSRIGRFVAYTPYVVVSGFMSGIGIIMIVIQCLPFLGMPAAPGGAGGAPGVAGGGGACQLPCLRHRRRDAGRGIDVASAPGATRAGPGGGAGGGHAAGGAVVE